MKEIIFFHKNIEGSILLGDSYINIILGQKDIGLIFNKKCKRCDFKIPKKIGNIETIFLIMKKCIKTPDSENYCKLVMFLNEIYICFSSICELEIEKSNKKIKFNIMLKKIKMIGENVVKKNGKIYPYVE
jgi:hypothetical protein